MKNLSYIIIVTFLCSLYACTKPLEACFTHSPEVLTTNTEAVFNASCSQNAYAYTWNFGDSPETTTTNSVTISHQYVASGTYTVTLGVQRQDSNKKAGKDKLIWQRTVSVQ